MRSVTGWYGQSGHADVTDRGRGNTGRTVRLNLHIAALMPCGLALLMAPDPQTGGLPDDPAAVCEWEVVDGPNAGLRVGCRRDAVGSRIQISEVPGTLHKCSACGLRQLIEDDAAVDEAGRDRFKRCPCRLEVYCSGQCQRQHWPLHKRVCPRAPPPAP